MSRFKLVFFSPITETPKILGHLFSKYPKNVGRIGEYEQCAFMSKGTGRPETQTDYYMGLCHRTLLYRASFWDSNSVNCAGQFKPVGSANPAIGEVGKVELVEEPRVEVLVVHEGEKNEIKGAVEELKKVRKIIRWLESTVYSD